MRRWRVSLGWRLRGQRLHSPQESPHRPGPTATPAQPLDACVAVVGATYSVGVRRVQHTTQRPWRNTQPPPRQPGSHACSERTVAFWLVVVLLAVPTDSSFRRWCATWTTKLRLTSCAACAVWTSATTTDALVPRPERAGQLPPQDNAQFRLLKLGTPGPTPLSCPPRARCPAA